MLYRWIDIERLIHSTKTMFACLIGIMLAKLIGFPSDQWIIVTIIVVMCAQIYVGSVFRKAFYRFFGTVLGCLFAIITIEMVGTSLSSIAFTIGLSSFFFSYLATSNENYMYSGTLGATTTAIIMLGQQPTVIFALERFLEITVGLVIATLVSQFFLPIHARTHLRRTQALTLEQLREYYAACMIQNKEETGYEDLDDDIIKNISKQRSLAKEATREPLGIAFNTERFMKTLHCEREILRAIDFMHNALTHIKNADILFSESKAFHAFNDTTMIALATLAKAIHTDDPGSEHIHIASTTPIQEEIKKQLSSATREELVYLDGLLFTAEVLTSFLKRLADLYHVTYFQDVPSKDEANHV